MLARRIEQFIYAFGAVALGGMAIFMAIGSYFTLRQTGINTFTADLPGILGCAAFSITFFFRYFLSRKKERKEASTKVKKGLTRR